VVLVAMADILQEIKSLATQKVVKIVLVITIRNLRSISTETLCCVQTNRRFSIPT